MEPDRPRAPLNSNSPHAPVAASDDVSESTHAVGPQTLEVRKPVDIRSVGISVIALVAVIWFLRSAQEALIPFVLSGLLCSALDPVVERLRGWRIPRAFGAAVVLLSAIAVFGFTIYRLSDEAFAVIEDLPAGMRKFRSEVLSQRDEASTLDKVKQAAVELDRTAAEAAGPPTASHGVMRVQVEEPAFSTNDFLWAGGMNAAQLLGLGIMVVFLSYFLLVGHDLFRRKLVKNIGTTLSEKKVTVQILDQIRAQIERFLLVQIFTSCVVGVTTGIALGLLGLKQAAVWGLLAGLFNSIPYFGPIVVTIGLSLVGYLQFGTLGMTAAIAGTAIAITSLEGWVLTPTLLGRVAQMNHVAVFAGLLFWSWMWGVWGLLLAIPMMMVIKSVCDHIEEFRPIGDLLGE